MTSPRGLSEGKTEPPDYILMFSSANVPGITYKINFGDLSPPCLEKNIQEFHQVKRDRAGCPSAHDFECHVVA